MSEQRNPTSETTSTMPAESDVDRFTRIIDLHLEAYCLPDAARRAEFVASAWSPDGVLVDPPFDGAGHAGIAAMTDIVLAHYADHRFERTTVVDAHHGVARYGWRLVGPDGEVPVEGLDVAEFGGDGRLTRVVGFFGPLAVIQG
jgi:hypothetical protein